MLQGMSGLSSRMIVSLHTRPTLKHAGHSSPLNANRKPAECQRQDSEVRVNRGFRCASSTSMHARLCLTVAASSRVAVHVNSR